MIVKGKKAVRLCLGAKDADAEYVMLNGHKVWPYDDSVAHPFTLLSRADGNEMTLTLTAPDPAEGEDAETLDVEVWVDGAASPTVLTATAGTPLLLATLDRTHRVRVRLGDYTPSSTRYVTFSATDSYEVYGDLLTLKGKTEVNGYDYYRLFYGSTTLVHSRGLVMPSVAMATYCFAAMFLYCTALVDAPELPAMKLARYCYYEMFYRCTALKRAQRILPATKLANYCYRAMFRYSGIEIAPVMPAEKLVTQCYHDQLRNCNSLRWVKALFTTTPGSTTAGNWMYSSRNESSCVFVKNEEATWTTTGQHSVPGNWTQYTCAPDDYTTPWDGTWEEPEQEEAVPDATTLYNITD
ncbi:MAG: hypothetical protein IJV38_08155 [Prevotella sp.]|nr:hypothetical protein [Prevotella sp.]